MSTSAENITERASRHPSSSDCKPLVDAATKDLFRHNAFRITGLPVDATAREITKHADRLKLMQELGQGAAAHTGVVALKPPPTMDQIRDALQKLKDPEKRLLDEFFWFWPEEFGQRDSDAGIQAVLRGGLDQAVEIWSSREDEPSNGVAAKHNLAILYHLCAVDWDSHAINGDADKARRAETTKYWQGSLKRWERLLSNDRFWDKVTNRIRQIDDARLTTGFVRRMRISLPQALSKINLDLALAFAEAGKFEDARRHVDLVRHTSYGAATLETTADLVLTPVRIRLKEHIRIAQERTAANPTDGASAARELVEQAKRSFALFDLFLSKGNDTRNELFDEVASTCNQIPVSYHKATGDDTTCLEIVRAALPFATSMELRQQIEKNINTLSGNLNIKKVDSIYTTLKSIQDSQVAPSLRLNRFRLEVLPAMSLAVTSLSASSEDHSRLFDSAATVLRGISLDAWNKHHDKVTALAANHLALEYVSSPELRNRLLEDDTTLAHIQERPPQWRDREDVSNAAAVGFIVIIGILAVIGVVNSCDSTYTPPPSVSVPASDPSSAPSPAPSTPTYTAPTLRNGKSGGNVYRVPSSASSTLDNEKAELESERATLEALGNQVEKLGREIDRARIYLDRTSQVAVDEFNAKIDRYNALTQKAKAANAAFNEKVDNYNTKLRQYGR